MRRTIRVFAVLIALVSVLGCGSATTGSVQQSPTGAPTTSSAQATPSPKADTQAAAGPTPTSNTPQPTVTTNAQQPTATASAPQATVTPSTSQATSTPNAGTATSGPIVIELQPIATGLDQPLYVTHAGDGSGRLFVVGKRGTITVIRDGAVQPSPFLDITDRVGSRQSERGLLSVAFHPRYAETGYLYVNYTDLNGNTVISRFHASGDAADPSSEVVLLTIDQPYANHNGGLMVFGPDGYLYVGTGDGGSAGDPHGNGQSLDTLLGKLLRIDVDGGTPYAIPPDNPWASGAGGRPEIWAYGLRNPWRFSFDRATGDLYIADVGQGAYEEVNLQRAGSRGGENYGWNVMEGAHCFRGSACDPSQFVLPITEYGREGGCSITGGYVYRGTAYPSLQGTYFFGDYCSGKIWSLRETVGAWEKTEVLDSDLSISSFGEDEAGELYVADLRGGVYRIVARP